jgi:hypothetical protein
MLHAANAFFQGRAWVVGNWSAMVFPNTRDSSMDGHFGSQTNELLTFRINKYRIKLRGIFDIIKQFVKQGNLIF